MRRWLTQRIHISWYLASAGIGVVVGIVLASLLTMTAGRGWLFGCIILTGLILRRRARWGLFIAVAVGLLLGLYRGGGEATALHTYSRYYDQYVHVQGYVGEDATYGPKGDQRLRLKHVIIDAAPMPGQLWVSVVNKTDVKRGDTVTISGTLSEGFGSLAASMHRARIERLEHHHPGDIARVVRDWFADAVRRVIAEPQASLGIGFLTGQRSALPPELDEQLRIAGLTHAVVASGYNLTILVAFARRLLLRWSKYLAAVSAGMMIVAFVLVTGLSPSMSRAGLVAMLSLLAWYYGRTIHPMVLLAVAAGITAMVEPASVWGDMGWYLSFTAFIGVILLAPLIRCYFWGHDVRPGMLGQVLTDTVAAQLMTLPIILGAFGQYAAYALPANMLVAPLIPLAMLFTFISGVTALIWPSMAQAIAVPSEWLLSYMTSVVEKIASLPGAQGELSFDGYKVAACYLVLAALHLFLWRATRLSFWTKKEDS